MSELVEQLKNEHLEIIKLLDHIDQAIQTSIVSNSEVDRLKIMLKEHFKKEREKLYPQLETSAETDPKLKQTLDLFSKEMEVIEKVVMEFFDNYEKQPKDVDMFSLELCHIRQILSTRIEREEQILYLF